MRLPAARTLARLCQPMWAMLGARSTDMQRIWRTWRAWWARALWLASALCLLAGCARDEAAQQQIQTLLRNGIAADMRHNTLMDAAFGVENEWVVPGEVYWQAQLPLPQPVPQTPENKAAHATAARASAASAALERIVNRHVAVRPRETVRLSDTQVALLVESVDVRSVQSTGGMQAAPALPMANRLPTAQEAAPAHMGVIFFEADAAIRPTGNTSKSEAAAETWRPTRFVPHVDYLMPGQSMPEVQVYKLDASRYLVTYAQTACRLGACTRWLKGYLLQPDAMTSAFATRLAGSNAWQHADCPARLGIADADAAASGLAASVRDLHAHQADDAPAATATAIATATAAATTTTATRRGTPARQAASAAAGKPAAAHACYAVHGEVHLLSRGRAQAADVQMRYSGVISDAPGRMRRIAQTQLFRLQGKQLTPVNGAASPVPGQQAAP